MELIPKSGVRCTSTTLANAKSQSIASNAMCYLLKRFFTQETLAKSSLGNISKYGYTQLPVKEINAIKGLF